MAQYYLNTFTANTTAVPYMITSTGSGANLTWGGSGSGSATCYDVSPYALPPAKPPTALEWLDAEVEKTCALARAA